MIVNALMDDVSPSWVSFGWFGFARCCFCTRCGVLRRCCSLCLVGPWRRADECGTSSGGGGTSFVPSPAFWKIRPGSRRCRRPCSPAGWPACWLHLGPSARSLSLLLAVSVFRPRTRPPYADCARAVSS